MESFMRNFLFKQLHALTILAVLHADVAIAASASQISSSSAFMLKQ
jgi:hypothetical protein